MKTDASFSFGKTSEQVNLFNAFVDSVSPLFEETGYVKILRTSPRSVIFRRRKNRLATVSMRTEGHSKVRIEFSRVFPEQGKAKSVVWVGTRPDMKVELNYWLKVDQGSMAKVLLGDQADGHSTEKGDQEV